MNDSDACPMCLCTDGSWEELMCGHCVCHACASRVGRARVCPLCRRYDAEKHAIDLKRQNIDQGKKIEQLENKIHIVETIEGICFSIVNLCVLLFFGYLFSLPRDCTKSSFQPIVPQTCPLRPCYTTSHHPTTGACVFESIQDCCHNGTDGLALCPKGTACHRVGCVFENRTSPTGVCADITLRGCCEKDSDCQAHCLQNSAYCNFLSNRCVCA